MAKANAVMTVKMLAPLVCECGSVLVHRDHDGTVQHDQYARDSKGALDENQPLTCKWAGQRFDGPTLELVPATV